MWWRNGPAELLASTMLFTQDCARLGSGYYLPSRYQVSTRYRTAFLAVMAMSRDRPEIHGCCAGHIARLLV